MTNNLSTRRVAVPLLACVALLSTTGRADAQLELLGKRGPKPLSTVSLPDWGTSAAWSADGKQLAIGTYGKVLLVDPANGKTIREIPVKSGYVRGVAWLPDSATLITGCFQAVEFWNVADGALKQTIKVKGYANDVKVSPDGSLLAIAAESGDVQICSTTDGAVRTSIEASREPVTAVAFSTDGQFVAAVGGDDTRLSRPGFANLWKVADGAAAQALDVVPEKCAADVAFSPDDKTLYVADLNDRVTVFDMSTGVARGYFGKHARPVNSVAPFKDGQRVVSGGGGRFQDGNVVKFWTPADGKEIATLEHHAGKVSRVALSPDETRLVTVSFDKTAAIWDVAQALTPAAPKLTNPLEKQSARTRSTPRLVTAGPQFAADLKFPDEGKFKRVGIIGLDTSHVTAFTKEFNPIRFPDPKDTKGPKDPVFIEQAPELRGFRITAAYPKGSPDIESSVSRVPGYVETVKAHNVRIVNSIPELLKDVDYVLLETNDGRPHLEQVLPVLEARKPVFIDKPIAGSLADAVAIFEAARHYGTPVFSSSSLRYAPGPALVRAGKLGPIAGADSYSPCSLEATHPDLYWYGIHGVEILFTAMGTGCESVSRTSTPEFDFAVGKWKDGRIGSFRGNRGAKSTYGLSVFSKTANQSIDVMNGPPGKTDRKQSLYFSLLAQVVQFYKTGTPPVSEDETLEIYAFMSAADESKKQGGAHVTLDSVLTKARAEAKEILKGRLK